MRKSILLLCIAAFALSAQDVNSTIANGIKPPQVETPTETMMRMERLRRLQLENQRLQIDNKRAAQDLNADVSKQSAVQQPKQPATLPDSLYKNIHTFGFLNGRAWKMMPALAQTAYLLGVVDGLAFQSPEKLPDQFPATLSYDEALLAVTRFYDEPENLVIRSAMPFASSRGSLPACHRCRLTTGSPRPGAAPPPLRSASEG